MVKKSAECGYVRIGKFRFKIKNKKYLPKINIGLLLLIAFLVIRYIGFNYSASSLQFLYSFLAPILIMLLVFCLWLRYRERFVSKEILTNFFILLSSSILLFFGLYMLDVSRLLETAYSNVYNEYYFQISLNPTSGVNMYNFLFFYNFAESKGNVSFTVSKEDLNNTQNIRMSFPRELNISSVVLSNPYYQSFADVNVPYQVRNNEKNSYVDVDTERLNISNGTDSVKFSIALGGQMYPSGKFILDIDVLRVWAWPDPSIIFNLKNYECVYPCFGNTMNSFESNTSSSFNLEGHILKVFTSKDYYSGATYRIFHNEFSLNTFNTDIRERIDLYKSVGSGVVVSAIFLFIEFIFISLKSLF